MCFIYICRNYAKATFSNAFFYNAVVWPHSFLSCFVLLLARTDTMSSFSVLLWGFHCNLIDTHIIVNFQKHGHGTPSQFTDSDNCENTQSTASRKRVQQASKLHLLFIIPVFIIQTSCLTIDTQKSRKGQKIRAEIWLWKHHGFLARDLPFPFWPSIDNLRASLRWVLANSFWSYALNPLSSSTFFSTGGGGLRFPVWASGCPSNPQVVPEAVTATNHLQAQTISWSFLHFFLSW